MVFEHIEKRKQDYTDKYVIVDDSRPELRRFKDKTGLVKTVNMNGHALVEFEMFNNIGWFDIDIDYLKIIDKPLPKPEPKKEAKKPAAKKPAAKKADAKPAAGGGGMSVADMLAAARGEKSGGGAPTAAPAKTESAPAKAAAPAKPAAGKMSVEEMLAAARAEKSADAAPAAAVVEEAPAPEPVEEPAAEPVEETPAAAPTAKGDLPTDTAAIIEFCRKTDG